MKAAIMFRVFGPYNKARLRALARLSNWTLTGIRLCVKDDSRPWDDRDTDGLYETVTLSDVADSTTNSYPLTQRVLGTFRSVKPDVVILAGYTELPFVAAALWAQRHASLNILLSESTLFDHRRGGAWKGVMRRAFIKRLFHGAFVGGERARRYLENSSFPPGRIVTGYDVVDNSYFEKFSSEARRTPALKTRMGLPSQYFLYVGRFSPEKNLLNLLRAYKLYRTISGSQAWPLVLVGDGPQRPSIEQLVAVERLEGVYLTGFRQVEELPVYYAFAGCFVLASSSEPWGLVVNEAMACGLPVLVSERCGCVPELVRDGINGYTFDPHDERKLSELMLLVSSQKAGRQAMGEASRFLVARFTPETWAKNLLQLVCKLRPGSFEQVGKP